MLPPLGIVFGLFVAFIAAQVWNDNERAEAAVNREASALRTAVVLSSDFAEAGERLRRLIRAHIKETIIEEWPKLAHQSATLSFTPPFLAQALQLTLSLTPDNDGQRVAQREIAAAIGNAFDAPAAHHHQPLAGQCGEVGVPYSAGDLRSHRDRDGA